MKMKIIVTMISFYIYRSTRSIYQKLEKLLLIQTKMFWEKPVWSSTFKTTYIIEKKKKPTKEY